jgi:hypothetical protein
MYNPVAPCKNLHNYVYLNKSHLATLKHFMRFSFAQIVINVVTVFIPAPFNLSTDLYKGSIKEGMRLWFKAFDFRPFKTQLAALVGNQTQLSLHLPWWGIMPTPLSYPARKPTRNLRLGRESNPHHFHTLLAADRRSNHMTIWPEKKNPWDPVGFEPGILCMGDYYLTTELSKHARNTTQFFRNFFGNFLIKYNTSLGLALVMKHIFLALHTSTRRTQK